MPNETEYQAAIARMIERQIYDRPGDADAYLRALARATFDAYRTRVGWKEAEALFKKLPNDVKTKRS